MQKTVLYNVVNRIATITLNRPETLNAINKEMRDELINMLMLAEADENVRVVILTGSGNLFSAGADLTEIGDVSAEYVEKIIVDGYKPIVLAIDQMPKLVISAINGGAVGVGAAIAMAADLTVMAEDSFIYQAFAPIGLIPDGGTSWQLVNTLGYKIALQLVVDGAKISDKQCLSLGLVNKIVPEDRLLDEVSIWAKKLSKGAPISQKYSKQVLKKAMRMTLEETIKLEAQFQKSCVLSNDYAEGVDAFLNRRVAEFTGK